MKNKCKDAGFEHAWVDDTNYGSLAMNQPSNQRKCANCGARSWETHTVEKWIQYEEGGTAYLIT